MRWIGTLTLNVFGHSQKKQNTDITSHIRDKLVTNLHLILQPSCFISQSCFCFIIIFSNVWSTIQTNPLTRCCHLSCNSLKKQILRSLIPLNTVHETCLTRGQEPHPVFVTFTFFERTVRKRIKMWIIIIYIFFPNWKKKSDVQSDLFISRLPLVSSLSVFKGTAWTTIVAKWRGFQEHYT